MPVVDRKPRAWELLAPVTSSAKAWKSSPA